MIELVDVACARGGRTVVAGVSLSIGAGRVLALLGPNGVGKTSLLRVIAGLDPPATGEVRLGGRTVSTPRRCDPPHTRRTALIFQDLALWPHMTVVEHLRFACDPRRGDPGERVRHLLEVFHLGELRARRPDELSGGERQRLAIARALASEPLHLLLDEPFSHLDDLLREELLDHVRRIRERGAVAILYVTHRVEEAIALADQVAVLSRSGVRRLWEGPQIETLRDRRTLAEAYGGGA